MAQVAPRSVGLWVLLALFLVVNAALLTEIATYSRNTPDHHPEWFLGKMIPQKQPFCIWDCMRTRNLLARNRLNLAAWHGYQEVFFQRPVDFERVRFRYRLNKEAYLVVILSLSRAGYTGLWLGQNGCRTLVADPSGRFLEEHDLALGQSGGARWHSCEITPGKLSLDGQAPVDIPQVKTGLFGFRGSLANAEVDDVEIWAGGRRLIRENFRNDRNFAAVAKASLGVLALLTGVALLTPHLPLRRRLLWTLLAHLTAGAVMLLYLFVDYTLWSARYAENEPPEKARVALFSLWDGADPVTTPSLAAVQDFLGVRQPPKSEYRLQVYREGRTFTLPEGDAEIEAFRRLHPKKESGVLFLGCSQNGGEGSLRLEDGMVPQAQRLLGPEVEVISASKQGTNSSELIPRYFQRLYRFEPDLVVAYLGSNDGDPQLLASNLHRLAAYNKRHGVGTLLVLEANSPENPATNPPHLAEKHAAMREVAAVHNVPALDLEAHLRKYSGTGFLWWDEVHMTSYGHRLAGEFLARGIEKHIPRMRPWQKGFEGLPVTPGDR